MNLAIDMTIEHEPWASLGDLEAVARRALAAALATSGITVADGAEVSIVLGDDAFVQTLNRTWRGKDKPTNVLSFPTDEANAEMALGDIVVAYETCLREAGEEGQSTTDYLTHLLVHGFFHLLGYDHETDVDADRMESLESRALKTLGIASPYEAAEAASGEPAP